MNITVNRKYKKQDYTIGTLAIDGEKICDTLEPTDRGLTHQMSKSQIEQKKIVRETAIPTGTYGIDFRWSGKFRKRRAFLTGVPGFEGVLIHEGNTKKDTAGCILVGWNTERGRVTSSIKALDIVNGRIINAIYRGERVTLEVTG